jgi:hypothetical protein
MKPKPNRGGRPYRLNDPVTACALGAAVARKRTIVEAAALAAIGRKTFYQWLNRGRNGDPKFVELLRVVESQRMPFDFLVRRYSPRAIFKAVNVGCREGWF